MKECQVAIKTIVASSLFAQLLKNHSKTFGAKADLLASSTYGEEALQPSHLGFVKLGQHPLGLNPLRRLSRELVRSLPGLGATRAQKGRYRRGYPARLLLPPQ